MSESINVKLADADSNKKMIDLHRKLQGAFDVFAPSRRLVYDSRILKQSRRDLQERHLVLVSIVYSIFRIFILVYRHISLVY